MSHSWLWSRQLYRGFRGGGFGIPIILYTLTCTIIKNRKGRRNGVILRMERDNKYVLNKMRDVSTKDLKSLEKEPATGDKVIISYENGYQEAKVGQKYGDYYKVSVKQGNGTAHGFLLQLHSLYHLIVDENNKDS